MHPTPEATKPTRMVTNGRRAAIERIGMPRRDFGDLYHALLDGSWRRLAFCTLALYLGVNAVFAALYVAGGDVLENARAGSFEDAFFFSVQTMATIGYGKMAPRGMYANAIVALEALVGLLGFAMVTGIVFAKFARPTARVLWSKVAVVAPRDGVPSLMFRMANARKNQIVEAQLRLVLARSEKTLEGERVRRFYDLELSRSQTAIFALSWTAIHPITPKSPLHGETAASLAENRVEIIASLVGIDETFAQTVHARHSYLPDEIAFGARFVDVISDTPDGTRRIDYTQFHEIVPPAA